MTRLDIRAYACPLTWVKTRIALERLPPGESLEVLLAEGEALESVPRSAVEEGHALVAREPVPAEGKGSWRLVLRKGQAPEGSP